MLVPLHQEPITLKSTGEQLLNMVTRWSPDTCDCVVEYDTNLVLTKIIRRCVNHELSSLDDNGLYNTLTEENPRKNKAFQEILDRGPSTLYDLQSDGTRTFKNGINVSWTWSGTAPNRVLSVSVTGVTLSTNQRNNIQQFLDNKFGQGKVLLLLQ